MVAERDWTILLIGGSVGTGKSTLSRKLAAHFGVLAIEGDLFRQVLLSAVPKETQPELHRFGEPDTWTRPTEELVADTMAADMYLCHMSELVLTRQDVRQEPSILEAVWVQPEFAVQESFAGQSLKGRVRSLFLVEPEIDAIEGRLAQRGEWWSRIPAEQREARVAFFHAFGLEVRRRAEALGLPVLESRPFDTLLDRALVALDASPS
jgi:2-phosphoglycerate kinase